MPNSSALPHPTRGSLLTPQDAGDPARFVTQRAATLLSAGVLVGVLFALPACGGSNSSPAEAPAASPTEPSEALVQEPQDETSVEPSGPMPIPSACHDEAPPCTANPGWVRKLCAEVYPDVALYLFRKASPFAHGYITRKTKAVNASGGVTSGDEWLEFDEEVVVLHQRKASSGIQVSGAEGGFDALRADGSCVTLDSTELTLTRPPKAKHARVQWRYLSEDTQDALKKNQAIFDTYVARKRECKGAYSGEVSKKCVDLDTKLNTLILEGLKAGTVDLDPPKKRP